MYISSRVHDKKSCYKVAKCICHHLCITRNVVIKLQNVYIITSASEGKLVKVVECNIIKCASLGKLVEGCGVYMSSHVHNKESS